MNRPGVPSIPNPPPCPPPAARKRREALRRLEDTVDALFGDKAKLDTSKQGERYHCVLKVDGTPDALLALLDFGGTP